MADWLGGWLSWLGEWLITSAHHIWWCSEAATFFCVQKNAGKGPWPRISDLPSNKMLRRAIHDVAKEQAMVTLFTGYQVDQLAG